MSCLSSQFATGVVCTCVLPALCLIQKLCLASLLESDVGGVCLKLITSTATGVVTSEPLVFGV